MTPEAKARSDGAGWRARNPGVAAPSDRVMRNHWGVSNARGLVDGMPFEDYRATFLLGAGVRAGAPAATDDPKRPLGGQLGLGLEPKK